MGDTRYLEHRLGRVTSYGLLEDVGQSRTAVDQSDGDDTYFELCSELYGGTWAKVFIESPRENSKIYGGRK